MLEKLLFKESLSKIKELAEGKDRQLTVEEIRSFFEKTELDDSQYELVYEYLESQKIKIIGHTLKENSKVSESDSNNKSAAPKAVKNKDPYLRLYLSDLKRIAPPAEGEPDVLYEAVKAGDTRAKSRLVELNLQMVAEIAESYKKRNLPVIDLIQEGNVGLMLAVENLKEKDVSISEPEYLEQEIHKSICEAIEIQDDCKRADQEIAEKVNYLCEAIKNLSEELDGEVSLDELSGYLEMPEEEIKEILKIAGDEIKTEESSNHKHNIETI